MKAFRRAQGWSSTAKQIIWKPAEEDRAWQCSPASHSCHTSWHTWAKFSCPHEDSQQEIGPSVFFASPPRFADSPERERRENLLVFGLQCTVKSLDSEPEGTSIKTETSVPIIHGRLTLGTISLTLQCMQNVHSLTLTMCRQLSACSLMIPSNGKRRKPPRAETHPRIT